MSADSFRQSLSRARRDLYQFMHGQCGLITAHNPCCCQKKTKGFIEAGHVDPDRLQFVAGRLRSVSEAAECVVIAEFPTLQEARDGYESPAYQKAAQHWHRGAVYLGLIVEGV